MSSASVLRSWCEKWALAGDDADSVQKRFYARLSVLFDVVIDVNNDCSDENSRPVPTLVLTLARGFACDPSNSTSAAGRSLIEQFYTRALPHAANIAKRDPAPFLCIAETIFPEVPKAMIDRVLERLTAVPMDQVMQSVHTLTQTALKAMVIFRSNSRDDFACDADEIVTAARALGLAVALESAT